MPQRLHHHPGGRESVRLRSHVSRRLRSRRKPRSSLLPSSPRSCDPSRAECDRDYSFHLLPSRSSSSARPPRLPRWTPKKRRGGGWAQPRTLCRPHRQRDQRPRGGSDASSPAATPLSTRRSRHRAGGDDSRLRPTGMPTGDHAPDRPVEAPASSSPSVKGTRTSRRGSVNKRSRASHYQALGVRPRTR